MRRGAFQTAHHRRTDSKRHYRRAGTVGRAASASQCPDLRLALSGWRSFTAERSGAGLDFVIPDQVGDPWSKRSANQLPTLKLGVRPWIPDQVGDDNAMLGLVSLVLHFWAAPSKQAIRPRTRGMAVAHYPTPFDGLPSKVAAVPIELSASPLRIIIQNNMIPGNAANVVSM